MKIHTSNNITIEQYSQEMLDYCNKTLTLDNPDYLSAVKNGRYARNIDKEIKLFKRNGNKLILPFGTLSVIWSMIPKDAIRTFDVVTTSTNTMQGHIELYDYQEKAVNNTIIAKHGILKAPCGSGKTQMGLALIEKTKKKTLWLTHTSDLLKQSKKRAEQYFKGDFGIITGGKVDIGNDITFATVQTMCKLDLKQLAYEFEMIIVDECFPKGTMVSTENGYKDISEIVVGDKVKSYNHETNKMEIQEVGYLFKKKANNMITVKIDGVDAIHCTKNHPFYTKSGYKKGEDLQSGDYLLCYMPKRSGFDKIKQNRLSQNIEKRFWVLLERMFKSRCEKEYTYNGRDAREKQTNNDCNEQALCKCKNEKEQSDAQRRNEKESFGFVEENRPQAINSWWKWNWNDKTTRNAIGCVEKQGDTLYRRICDSNRNKAWEWISNLLQSRYCFSKQKNSNRSGRKFTLPTFKTRARQEENGTFEWKRLESVTVQEQTNCGKFGGMCSDGYVYNIEVANNNNYFVNDILVHNCHRAAGSPTKMTQFYKVLDNLKAPYKFGLTATTHRADNMIQGVYSLIGNVVHEVSASNVTSTLKASVNIVHTNLMPSLDYCDTDGTMIYSELMRYIREDEERNNLIASLVDANRNTLILSTYVEHCEHLQSLIPNSKIATGKTSAKNRDEIFDSIKNSNTKGHVLISTYSLAKEGLDIPNLDTLILATPQKDFAIVKQSVGRIERKACNKTDAIVHDIVDFGIGYCAGAYKKRKAIYKGD